MWHRARGCRVETLGFDVGGKRPEPSRLRDVALCPVAVIAEEPEITAHVAKFWMDTIYSGAVPERTLFAAPCLEDQRGRATGAIGSVQGSDLGDLNIERQALPCSPMSGAGKRLPRPEIWVASQRIQLGLLLFSGPFS